MGVLLARCHQKIASHSLHGKVALVSASMLPACDGTKQNRNLNIWRYHYRNLLNQDIYIYVFGPAKTYILRGTPRTHAIKARVATDNLTIKKDPRKGNRRPVKGTDGPVRGIEDPVTGTGPLLIARNPF